MLDHRFFSRQNVNAEKDSFVALPICVQHCNGSRIVGFRCCGEFSAPSTSPEITNYCRGTNNISHCIGSHRISGSIRTGRKQAPLSFVRFTTVTLLVMRPTGALVIEGRHEEAIKQLGACLRYHACPPNPLDSTTDPLSLTDGHDCCSPLGRSHSTMQLGPNTSELIDAASPENHRVQGQLTLPLSSCRRVKALLDSGGRGSPDETKQAGKKAATGPGSASGRGDKQEDTPSVWEAPESIRHSDPTPAVFKASIHSPRTDFGALSTVS